MSSLPGPSETHLWSIPHDSILSEPLPLSASELNRARRYQFENDRHRHLLTHSALRIILASYLQTSPQSLGFSTNPAGKPLLNSPHHRLSFNLSHSLGLSLLALSTTNPVGIDLEPTHRNLSDLADTILHPSEKSSSPNLIDFWTAKEAYLKALGLGLQIEPKNVLIDFPGATASTPGHPTLTIQKIPSPTHSIHLCPAARITRFSYQQLNTGKREN